MPATSTNVLFPGHNHLLTTDTRWVDVMQSSVSVSKGYKAERTVNQENKKGG